MTSHTHPTQRRGRHAFKACVLLTTSLSAGAALAQQAPAGLESAIATADQWVMQADANQADAMWSASNAVMQKSVSQTDWHKYIADVRQHAGAEQARMWVGVSRVENPQSMPPGLYLNVIYNTRFAHVAAMETVSLMQDGSRWQPVGYIVNPAQTQATSGAPQPTSSK